MGGSDAFSLRVSSIASDIRQTGPARIVSNSPNISVRNFTFGQQGSNLVFRLRTAATGLNGARPEIVVPDVFASGQPRDVLVSYDGASVLVAAAHSNVVRRTDFTPGATLALAMTSLPIRSADLPYLHAIYLAGLFLVPGVIVAALGHTPRGRLMLGVAWLVPFVLVLEATLVMVSGKAFTWGAVSRSAAIGALVLPAVVLTMGGSAKAGRYA
jgi:hypothetical protein